MALNEQMQQMIQQDIQDAKTKPKKEILQEQVAGLKSTGKFIGETAVESIPGVSQAIGVKRTSDALEEDDYIGAGIEGTALAASVVPGIGPAVAKGLRKFNKTRKAYKLFVKGEDGELYPLFVDANKSVKQGKFLEANFPDVAFKGKRKEGSKESFYVPTKGAKRSKGEKAKGTGDSIIIPDETTRKKLIDEGFITEKTRRTKEAPFGRVTAVAARPGWHASQAPVATHLGPQDLKVTKKEAEKLIKAGVTPEAIKRRGNQFYVKRRAEDQVFAEVDMADDVDYQSMLAKEGRSDINDRVPKGGSYRYSDGQADSDQWVVGGDMKVNKVLSREETRAIQKEMGVVDLPYRDEVEAILEKKFAKGGVVMDDYLLGKLMDKPQNFAEGGVVPMNNMAKQMEMFEDGGLMDEGGTVDPISGNDVPPGSTQEEVRDDIPAQLSEGEFVFPADVVRYFGLEKLMEMRQEAKMGLQRMEDMGQMGNSEEAIMPDNLPFNIDDLDMEDEEEPSNTREFNVGGFATPSVAPTYSPAGTYSLTGQPAPAPTVAAPVQAASAQQVQPGTTQLAGTKFTPTAVQGVMPTFQETIGAGVPGVDFEMVDYINEAGQIIQLRKNKATGEMLDPIPEGYRLKSEQVESAVTTPTTVESAQVSGGDGEGAGDEGVTSGATISFGGSLNEKGLVENSIRGTVSYRGANYGTGPLGLGGLQDVKGLLGRSLSSGINQMTGGKMGTPMSLKPGESIVIENMVQTRPGVNRSTALASGIGLEVDDEFYNAHISGGTVTGRKTLEKVANYLNDNYKGLGKGSVINASQILAEIEKEEKEQARKEKVEAAQRLSGAARDRAFGVQDPSSPTGYTKGSVISDAIAEAQADEDAAEARGDRDGFGDDGSMDGGAAAGGGTTSDSDVGYGSGTDCLTEDMKVNLNGVVDFVTNVKVGDIIDNYKVKEVLHKHMREGYYSINKELKISNDHPVLANGTWTRPEDLVVGDSINGIPVSSLEYVEQLTPTVSIIIDGESFDVHTENNTYTVHGRYREVRQEAA